jgi:integrase
VTYSVAERRVGGSFRHSRRGDINHRLQHGGHPGTKAVANHSFIKRLPPSSTFISATIIELKKTCDLDDIHFHDIRAKSLTDAKWKHGSDYAQALGNHASVETTESYIKTREVNTVEPLF